MAHLPPEIRTHILNAAREAWPDDFEMQKYTLEHQTNAYFKLLSLYSRLEKNETTHAIFSRAEAAWKHDYEMRLYEVTHQLEALEALYTRPDHASPQTPKAPAAIIEAIKIRACTEWPGDYEMQHHTLEGQLEAYRKVEAFKDTHARDSAAQSVITMALSEWPDDYEMQLHTIEEQMSALKELANYRAPNVPVNVLVQIRQKAVEEWPDDFAMQLHTIENQVNAWRALNAT
ncbi:hypothetical protein FRC98_05670 [Lujinxingia vulgaris]|uniref:Uncharacterized protein n=1 Tax=Lujinxingia vulgaris TaxID=2600176 RepID=A0A5C6XD60_9DELT|nr:hypothetical protein [Lujinxingia vulgaris]TXD38378.1 hypothetical protein FRC98_05670 [Lujinxingia vulgaris]